MYIPAYIKMYQVVQTQNRNNDKKIIKVRKNFKSNFFFNLSLFPMKKNKING